MLHAPAVLRFTVGSKTLAHELGHAWGLMHANDPRNEFDYTGMEMRSMLMYDSNSSGPQTTFAPDEVEHVNEQIQNYKERYGDDGVLNFLPGDNTKELPVDDNIDDNIDDNNR